MTSTRRGTLKPTLIVFLLLSGQCLAQAGSVDHTARKQIDAGNQAWIDGVKRGEASLIAATYTADALDCNPAGECILGRPAIEQYIKDQFAKRGHAQSASVTSVGSVQQGDFAYEWGQSEALFAPGVKIVHRYLTVWRKQDDGGWKIFRNMVIANDSQH